MTGSKTRDSHRLGIKVELQVLWLPLDMCRRRTDNRLITTLTGIENEDETDEEQYGKTRSDNSTRQTGIDE